MFCSISLIFLFFLVLFTCVSKSIYCVYLCHLLIWDQWISDSSCDGWNIKNKIEIVDDINKVG